MNAGLLRACRIHRFGLPLIVTIIVICLCPIELLLAQSSKVKSKASAKNSPDVEDDFWKYAAQLTGEESPVAAGKSVTLALVNGKTLTDYEITEAALGKGEETLKSLAVQDADGKKKQKLVVGTVARIRSGENDYDVILDPAKKGHVLIDVTRRDVDVNERLKASRHQLWTDPSDEERAQTIADYKEFLLKVQANYQFPTRLHETKFFLFFTDMPLNQVGPYVAYLDNMYLELCKAFGVPKDKNIWLGKCIIVAFLNKESFLAFEQAFMDNPNAEGAQGLHHASSDGKAIISVYRGNDPAQFAAVLVHETAHGFLHRLRSNVHIPPWINEGIADWIAGAVVRSGKAVVERQKEALEIIRRTSSLGVNFFDDRADLQAWQYGVASNLTNFMLQIDPGRYKAFIVGIKEGYSLEEALTRSYGLTPADLLGQYGRSVGVANLRP